MFVSFDGLYEGYKDNISEAEHKELAARLQQFCYDTYHKFSESGDGERRKILKSLI